MRFFDREEAGVHLGGAVQVHATPDALVLALPRGGVVVGYHVARALGLPLGVVVCCKVVAPERREFALGAVAEGGASWLDVGRARALEIAPEALRRAARAAVAEVERRIELYRGGEPLKGLVGRRVLLVDDGIASGTTVRTAVEALRGLGVGALIVAAPVAACSTADGLRSRADAVVCLNTPAALISVSQWYDRFERLTDADVLGWLARARRDRAGALDQRPTPAPLT